MTHSGGKPHSVGDKGQRYEVSYFNPRTNKREVMGWTDNADRARKMGDAIDVHPSWELPQVSDRALCRVCAKVRDVSWSSCPRLDCPHDEK